jgi:hypothetical protein
MIAMWNEVDGGHGRRRCSIGKLNEIDRKLKIDAFFGKLMKN